MILPGPDNRWFKTMRGIIYGWLVLLVLSIYPYTEDPVTPVKVLMSGAASLLLTLVWAVAVLQGRVAIRPLGTGVYLLFTFLAINCASALLSPWPERSLHSLLPWVLFAILALLSHQVFSQPRHLRNLFRVVVGATAVASLYGLMQHLGLDPFPWAERGVEEYRGLPATFGHPNVAGHTLVIALVLCGGLSINTWRRSRGLLEIGLCGFAAALMLTHLYLTHMRGGPLALGLAGLAVVLAFVSRRWLGTGRVAWCSAVALVLLLLGGTAITVMALAPELRPGNSVQLRLNGYAGAASMFLDHWKTGVGPGNYPAQSIAYWSSFESLWYAIRGKYNFHAHNEWLEVAAETGVSGLFVFLLLFLNGLYAPFLRTDRQAVLRYAQAVAVLAIIIDGCVGFNLHVPVSGALAFLMLTIRADGTERWTRPGLATRFGAIALLLFVGLQALDSARRFQGERYYQQGQGALAWAETHPATEQHGENPVLGAAWDRFGHAIQLIPWDHRPWVARGDLHSRLGKPVEALDDYEHALRLSPHQPRLHVRLAKAALAAAQVTQGARQKALLETAANGALAAVARCPELGEGHAALGWAYQLGGEAADQALAAFEAARQLGMADDVPVNYGLARAALDSGDTERATTALLKALKGAPHSADLWDLFATVAAVPGSHADEQYRQALSHYVAVDRTLPVTLRANLAHRLISLPAEPWETRVARKSIEMALDAHPDEDGIWTAWLATLPEADVPSAFRHRVQQSEGTGPVVLLFAKLLAGGDDGADTIKQLADRLAISPQRKNTPSPHQAFAPLMQPGLEAGEINKADALALGRLLFYLGLWAEAETALQRAERTVTADRVGEVAFYRSRVLARRNQPSAALALAREALRTAPASISYQWNFGLRLAEAGEIDAARFQLDALLSQVRDDPDARQAIATDLEALPPTGGAP